jgi:Flp pilus assembly protein TadG
MLHRHSRYRRQGATLVEAAIVYPVFLLLTVGVIVVGLGMFRYNQMASLAREGARWASVRGSQYASDTGNATATSGSSGSIATYVKSLAAGLDTNSLTVTTSWSTSNDSSTPGKNAVSVTVSYPWVPEAYFGGVTLTSTSVMTISY